MTDAGSGVEPAGGPTESLDARILLARSHRMEWVAIRAIIENEPGARIVADEERVDRAARRAAELQPDAIVMDALPAESPAAVVARRFRDLCPRSRLLVFGAEPNGPIEHAFVEIGVDGFILWDDVTPKTLHYALCAALLGGWCVGSRAAVRELAAGPERRRHPRSADIVFSDRERKVLSYLADGLFEREIAVKAGIGLRSAQRTARALEDRLGVYSLLEL